MASNLELENRIRELEKIVNELEEKTSATERAVKSFIDMSTGAKWVFATIAAVITLFATMKSMFGKMLAF